MSVPRGTLFFVSGVEWVIYNISIVGKCEKRNSEWPKPFAICFILVG